MGGTSPLGRPSPHRCRRFINFKPPVDPASLRERGRPSGGGLVSWRGHGDNVPPCTSVVGAPGLILKSACIWMNLTMLSFAVPDNFGNDFQFIMQNRFGADRPRRSQCSPTQEFRLNYADIRQAVPMLVALFSGYYEGSGGSGPLRGSDHLTPGVLHLATPGYTPPWVLRGPATSDLVIATVQWFRRSERGGSGRDGKH